MARGPKKHLKRVNAPHHWMLSKLGGTWVILTQAPRPSTGPHKQRECVPLVIILRNRLRYALDYREATMIAHDQRGQIKVDHKIRTDVKFPVGFMDIISIDKTGENFRLLYDLKRRFILQRIEEDQARFKLCKVKKRLIGSNKVPYIVTHDGRTIRYPHPDISSNDTVKLDLISGEIESFVKFVPGNVAMVNGGRNTGRIGVITHTEVHDGGFAIAHLRDAKGNLFATRVGYAFIIGEGKHSWISLPKGNGIRKTILEEQAERFGKHKN